MAAADSRNNGQTFTCRPKAFNMSILHIGQLRCSISHGSMHDLWNTCLQHNDNTSQCMTHTDSVDKCALHRWSCQSFHKCTQTEVLLAVTDSQDCPCWKPFNVMHFPIQGRACLRVRQKFSWCFREILTSICKLHFTTVVYRQYMGHTKTHYFKTLSE